MPYLDVRRVCVIGAGTMGSGIAAHLANLGFEVSLLDVTSEAVHSAFERARSTKPPHFYLPERANGIRLGSIANDLAWVGEADWVCEAVVERPGVKRSLYAQIEPHLREDAFISTNTSGLEISLLGSGRSDSFRRRFVGTHFFNPPRYLKLLELIPTNETDAQVISEITQFLEDRVARRVVLAKDTPGFIANRFGMWSMFHATRVAEKLQLTVEEVDQITGPFLGRPKSGTFRLNDIVGLDVMRDIASNLIERCTHDASIRTLELTPTMHHLLEKGWLGEKTGHGYYRKEGKEFLALDLRTFAYRNRIEPEFGSIAELGKKPFPERLKTALEQLDPVGDYLREYLLPALRYAEEIREEISHSVLDFDRVMKWGFDWSHGPFELIDLLGPERIGIQSGPNYQGDRVRCFGTTYISLPHEPRFKPLAEYPILDISPGLVVRDLGDGVHSIGMNSKMGILSPPLVAELTDYLTSHKTDGFVLTSEARSFSAGFDLRWFLEAEARGATAEIDAELARLQKLGELLESRGVVAAIFGHCLGGGLELAMSCPVVVALAETQIGLPESKVGLIPAGRGTTLTRLRAQHSAKRLVEVTAVLVRGEVATNAEQARQLGYLRPSDVTEFHPDRLIWTAKQIAKTLIPTPRPAWQAVAGPLLGMIDQEVQTSIDAGDLTEHDDIISQKLRWIVAKANSYEQALAKERELFLELLPKHQTQARIKHMLETGKPLKN